MQLLFVIFIWHWRFPLNTECNDCILKLVLILIMQVNLPDGVHEVKLEYIVPLSKLMTKAFLKNNPIWSKYQMTATDLDPFFENLLKDHLQSQQRAKKYMKDNASINYIYVQRRLVIATLLHFEIEEYRQKFKISQEPTLPVFKHMEKYGKELMKGIDLNIYEKGKHVYGNFGATDETIVKSKSSPLILVDFCKKLKDSGVKSMIGRSSNKKSSQLYQMLGAQILQELQFKENGIQEKVYLISIDFNNKKFLDLCQLNEKQKQVQSKL